MSVYSGAPASVFDRLTDPRGFTGVYGERFRSGPGINHDADRRSPARRSSFTGSTNAGTGEVVHDLSHITRDYLGAPRSPTSVSERAQLLQI